jgi:hypothetical protein
MRRNEANLFGRQRLNNQVNLTRAILPTIFEWTAIACDFAVFPECQFSDSTFLSLSMRTNSSSHAYLSTGAVVIGSSIGGIGITIAYARP